MAWLPLIAPSDVSHPDVKDFIRAKRADGLVLVQEFPQLERAAPRERMLDRQRTTQAKHVIGTVRTLDPIEPAGGSGNNDTKIGHERIPCDQKAGKHAIVVNAAQKRAAVTELYLCIL